jgi:uncharacterized repeat protein (TIGR01451 family)
MRTLRAWRSRLLAAIAITPVLLAAVAPAPARAFSTWVTGDVFVAIGNGSYNVFDSAGNLKETISDGLGGVTTGCTFNSTQSKLYTTNWELDKVEVYDATSHLLVQTLNTSSSLNESVVFAADGTFYVSHAGGNGIDHYSAAGVRLTTLALGVRSDWMDLSSDQRTMFFTDEGATIHRWDVSTDTRLADFATTPSGSAFGIRLLPPGDGSGGLLVTAAGNVLRYDGAGHVVQTYNNPVSPESIWFGLSLGVDATTFWAASTNRLYHFDLATGHVLLGPITAGPIVDGICVKGGATAAASADLSITKTASADPALVGGALGYTLTVSNAGPATATNVSVTDPLPANVSFISATPSQGSCTQAAGTVSCGLGTLASGSQATITIQVSPTAKGSLTNTARVSADQSDPTSGDNTASVTTRALTGSGSAFGVQVRSLLVNVGPTPSVSQSGPGTRTATLATVSVLGLVSADVLTVSTQVGPGVTVTSSSDIAHLNLVLGAVVADTIHATCTANASGASGATTIARLVVAGQTLINITPAANTSITVPGVGQLVLNEQSRPTATSITVNAVHLSLIGGTDIIVAQASCDIDP